MPAGRALSDMEEVSEQEFRSRIAIAGDNEDGSRERTSETESHGGTEDHADRSEITARGCKKRRREWVWTLEGSSESTAAEHSLFR